MPPPSMRSFAYLSDSVIDADRQGMFVTGHPNHLLEVATFGNRAHMVPRQCKPSHSSGERQSGNFCYGSIVAGEDLRADEPQLVTG
jgi:hypothetical protein